MLAIQAAVDGKEILILPDYTELLPKYKKYCHTIWTEYFNERSLERGIWYKTIQCEPPRVPWLTDMNLSRSLIVTAFRLRSGHVPLNKFAHMMKRSESPNCEVCGVIEDVYHLLVE